MHAEIYAKGPKRGAKSASLMVNHRRSRSLARLQQSMASLQGTLCGIQVGVFSPYLDLRL